LAPSVDHVPAGRQRMQALSGLRFVAIAYVVWYHLTVNDETFDQRSYVVEQLTDNTNSVMPLFFLMSGFVLTYTYAERLESGSLTRRDFWLSRLLRLWPVYLVALGLNFAVHASATGGVSRYAIEGAVAQALLIQSWIPPYVWMGNAPGWTVSVEAFLYLVFPWLVVRLSQTSLRRGFALAAVLWVIGQLIAYSYLRYLPDGWPLRPAPGAPEPGYLDLLR
jgi:peptidoglycan/LPS O-acetylase OafA/YrhL